MRRRPGFTLIELLAATALFAVLGTMLFQIVRGAMDIWSAGERNRELLDRAGAALDLMAEDLRAAWPGVSGAAEQDSRFLCTFREEDSDGDGQPDRRVPLLRFARLCTEERLLPWLRRAGDLPGGERAATLLVVEDSAQLRPTGGLAESLYTLAVLPGQTLPSLVRRFRAPLGGEDSLLDETLPERPDRLLAGSTVIADQVLYLGVDFWGPGTTVWDRGPGAGPEERPCYPAWDSTRAILPPDDPSFPFGLGPASLLDGSDDMVPGLVRLVLVLDRDEGGATSGVLAEPLTAESRQVRLTSTTFLRDQDRPDHLLIDGEWMAVTAAAGTEFTVVRGARGTLPASHDSGARARTGRRFERIVELPAGRESEGP